MSELQVHATKNYDLFKKLSFNRDVSKENVEKLKKEILREDLLDCHPIIVNENMEIIAGQHRLEAARQLNKTIYYVIKDNLSKNTTFMNNWIGKRGRAFEAFKFYANEKNSPSYKFLLEMQDKYKINTTLVAALCGISKQRSYTQTLIDGSLVFNYPYEFLEYVIQCYLKFVEMIKINVPENETKFEAQKFALAFHKFMTDYQVDFEKFYSKSRVLCKRYKIYTNEMARWIEVFVSVYESRNGKIRKRTNFNIIKDDLYE